MLSYKMNVWLRQYQLIVYICIPAIATKTKQVYLNYIHLTSGSLCGKSYYHSTFRLPSYAGVQYYSSQHLLRISAKGDQAFARGFEITCPESRGWNSECHILNTLWKLDFNWHAFMKHLINLTVITFCPIFFTSIPPLPLPCFFSLFMISFLFRCMETCK